MGKKLISACLAGALIFSSISGPIQAYARSADGQEAPALPENLRPGTDIGACGLMHIERSLWLKAPEGPVTIDAKVSLRLLEIISKLPAGQAESALTQELRSRLAPGSDAEVFFDNSNGSPRLSPLGCRKLIGIMGSGAIPELGAVSPASAQDNSTGRQDLAALETLGNSPSLGNHFFDGTVADGLTETVDTSGTQPGTVSPVPSGQMKPGDTAQHAPPKPQSSLLRDRPPANWRGRVSRVAGIVATGATIGLISNIFWGPAAAAYYLTGSAIKSLKFNSDILGKARPVAEFINRHSTALRFSAGLALMAGGVFTGNPVATYFGMTFSILGAGEKAGKLAYKTAYKLLKRPEADKMGRKLDGVMQKIRNSPKQNEPKPAQEHKSGLSRIFHKIKTTVSANRGEIARVAIASAISVGAVIGLAFGTQAVLGNVMGNMAEQKGALSFQDKAKNTLIGAYRYYNLPGTAF
ncbi:MAG: hypothetical protein ABIG11_03910, partial [bacterium]